MPNAMGDRGDSVAGGRCEMTRSCPRSMRSPAYCGQSLAVCRLSYARFDDGAVGEDSGTWKLWRARRTWVASVPSELLEQCNTAVTEGLKCDRAPE